MSKRRLARENCLQSLYVTDIGAYCSDSAPAGFQMTDFALDGKTFNFYKELFSATVSSLEKIDSIIRSTSTNWDLARMSATDRSILRMAVCEMMILRDAPAPVIIDEAIELAKKYSTENSGKFVNGVLDSVAKNNNLIKGSSEISRPDPHISAGIGGESFTAHAGSAKARPVKTAHRRRSAANPQSRTAPEARDRPVSLEVPSQRPLAHKTANPVAGKTRRKSRPPGGPKADFDTGSENNPVK
jgi:N utilization substance protein B